MFNQFKNKKAAESLHRKVRLAHEGPKQKSKNATGEKVEFKPTATKAELVSFASFVTFYIHSPFKCVLN